MGIAPGGGLGNTFGGRRRPRRIQRGQAQKPFRPIENPFPETEGFRLGAFRLIEEKDDYLLCYGFDPRAKHPFAEVTPMAPRNIKVAKPSLLQKTPFDGKTDDLIVDGVATPVTFEYTGIGVRVATATIDGDEVEEVQRITMDYLVNDIIVAVELRHNAIQDGIVLGTEKVRDEGGGILSWMDLNIGGRCWAATGEDAPSEEE